MKYSFSLNNYGLYNVKIRVATEDDDGRFYFKINENQVTDMIDVPKTGSWEEWDYIQIDSLVLNSTDENFVFHVDQGTFNLSFFEFIRIGDISLVETKYISSHTLNERTLIINTNKDLDPSSNLNFADFSVFINEEDISINNIYFNNSPRSIEVELNHVIQPTDSIRITYLGNSVKSVDNMSLKKFTDVFVKNRIPFIHDIPGKIEAEHFFSQKGMELENTTDEGGGFNIGSLDNGDFADYYVDIETSGTYNVTYRTAADPSFSEGGQVELSIYDTNTNAFNFLQNLIIPPTTGWQDWENTSKALNLDSGKYQIRLKVLSGPFNLNWFSFDNSVSVGIPIPGYVQAEDFVFQEGISLEMSEDEGGGQNIGYLDSADYADYIVDVTKPGLYDLSYRVASDGSQDYANGGTIQLQLLEDSTVKELHTISFPPTTGWQDWVTFKNFPKINLESGDKKIRLLFTKTPFNLNWILFEDFEGTVLGLEKDDLRIDVFPNPTDKFINVISDYVPKNNINYKLVDLNGKIIYEINKLYRSKISEKIDINSLKSGLIFLVISEEDQLLEIKKILIKN